ncbi:aminoacyl-tRNA hydrolase [Halovulum dunhuangense]|uniref:Peptidyl-tRNA hydrolase n=1 Tax=Halovulum dunhuangense TaxID=1505036 RepID=A0A849KXQ9_9RHOB|nr:aminoacyl-tRNA hydrolase [Halovulum dunhuangense]NNU79427.1 aminoacyl-tRNA hydrolase [Halovulum dunhuangense]
MKILAGLGNPGAKYDRTRHNIGFMAVDAIAGAQGFGPWRAKFQGQVAEGTIGTEKVLLLKPETYMNLSGQSVGEAMRFYKLTPADVIVFHDELDLAPGKMRVKTGGGHAGHNGLRSLHQHIGADYLRVRLGIGHPGDKALVSHYVLSPFAKADEDWLTDLLDGIGRAVPHLVAGDASRFQTAVAARPAARPAPKPQAAPPAPAEAPKPDTRNPLQRLADHFRR